MMVFYRDSPGHFKTSCTSRVNGYLFLTRDGTLDFYFLRPMKPRPLSGLRPRSHSSLKTIMLSTFQTFFNHLVCFGGFSNVNWQHVGIKMKINDDARLALEDDGNPFGVPGFYPEPFSSLKDVACFLRLR